MTVIVLATLVGVARQRHDPEDEGERAAADAEINAGNPLRRREALERCKAALHQPRQHQHDGEPVGDLLHRGRRRPD
ncbi:hypothetical protein [Bradyrhizobium sp. IC3123]|uniref:hypothetical protein n=1 Tax=Bradyrhizobium sp. IC3123 TaxID=2793803 RepID=UPI001CD25176|nr:hypothetical protein [Bradyrhizobium sp. IC3123]